MVHYNLGMPAEGVKLSAIVNIQGVPFPPTNLAITDTCQNRTTTLSWVTSASNDAPILHFLVEQESNHEPNVFKLIYNVTNPNATSVTLNLTGWATLRFRLRAVNRLGPSRPSEATGTGICKTFIGKPDKYPDNLRRQKHLILPGLLCQGLIGMRQDSSMSLITERLEVKRLIAGQ